MNSLQHLPLSFAYDLPFETLRLVESTPETPVHRFCSMDHVCLSQISKASKRSKRLEMGAASLWKSQQIIEKTCPTTPRSSSPWQLFKSLLNEHRKLCLKKTANKSSINYIS